MAFLIQLCRPVPDQRRSESGFRENQNTTVQSLLIMKRCGTRFLIGRIFVHLNLNHIELTNFLLTVSNRTASLLNIIFKVVH